MTTPGWPADSGGERKPIPDPTRLTTEALNRATWAERDYVDAKLEVILERLRGVDRATILLDETVNRVPTQLQLAVAALRERSDQKFEMVQRQIDERGVVFEEKYARVEQGSRDAGLLQAERFLAVQRQFCERDSQVAAALASQKEAVAVQNQGNNLAVSKSEVASKETIGALSAKVDDLKDRINRLESIKQGGKEYTAGLYAFLGLILTMIVVGITVLSFVHH